MCLRENGSRKGSKGGLRSQEMRSDKGLVIIHAFRPTGNYIWILFSQFFLILPKDFSGP